MVQFDWSVGKVLSALDEHGLTDNTIVIFSSDNGPTNHDDLHDRKKNRKPKNGAMELHDGSGIWRGGKYQIYEGGTRVPFIIRWPGKIKPGTTSAAAAGRTCFGRRIG